MDKRKKRTDIIKFHRQLTRSKLQACYDPASEYIAVYWMADDGHYRQLNPERTIEALESLPVVWGGAAGAGRVRQFEAIMNRAGRFVIAKPIKVEPQIDFYPKHIIYNTINWSELADKYWEIVKDQIRNGLYF